MSFKKFIKITNNQYISNKHQAFIIAEIGINHEGKFKNCINLINKAKNAGANAVKIQLAKAENNYKKNSKSFKIYKKSELNENEISKLFKFSIKKNILLFATCDRYYLKIVKKLNQKLFKISSSQAQDLNIINSVNNLKKPMLISTGMNKSDDVVELIEYLKKQRNKKVVLMHCVSKYPLKNSETNLEMIEFLKNKFNGIIGYSDHTTGIQAPIYAVIKGAKVIEKHFTLDNKRRGYDHKISLNFKEFKDMVLKIKKAEAFLGNIKKNDIDKSKKEITSLKRTYFLNKYFKKGKKLTINDINARRIGKNSSLKSLLKLIGKKSVKNLSIGSKISENKFI